MHLTFFLLPQYNSKFTLFTIQSILHLPPLICTSTDASPPFSSNFLTHLPLNPLAAPSISSFCSCQVLFNRLPPEQISFCSHHGNHLALPNSQIHIDLPAIIFSSCSFLYWQLPYLKPLE